MKSEEMHFSLILPRLVNSGGAKVIIDGHDITRGVRSIELKSEAGGITTLMVEFFPELVEVKGEADTTLIPTLIPITKKQLGESDESIHSD